MTSAADFDVTSWLTGEKPNHSVSHHDNHTNNNHPYSLSIQISDKPMDPIGFFSPMIANEPQLMTLQTPIGAPPAAPFGFVVDSIHKIEADIIPPPPVLPAFDHGLLMNSSVQTATAHDRHVSSAHLSPLSDVSSPSDFEVDRVSPFSPTLRSNGHHNNVNNICYQQIQSIDTQFDDDSDTRSDSPSSEASYESNQTVEIISVAAPSIKNDNNNTRSANTKQTKKTAVSAKNAGDGKKRTKRRNLMNALKEHLTTSTTSNNNGEDGNTSGSESDLMHELTNRSSRIRGKRSAPSTNADCEGPASEDNDKDGASSKKERNKQSASAYRKRRKMYLDTLETKVELLNEKLTEQQQEMAKMENENKVLKEQVSFLKRLISFKTTNNNDNNVNMTEIKEDIIDVDTALPMSSSSSYSGGGFGAINSRLNILNYSTTQGNKSAGMFLFLLFSCFLLFNPMWSNDLSISNDGSVMESVNVGRRLLSYEDFHDPLNAAYPITVKKEDTTTVSQQLFAFPNQYIDTMMNPELSMPAPSSATTNNNQSSAAAPAPLSSSSSSASYPVAELSADARSKAFSELSAMANSFQMDPQSQEFAELVAASYLPLVNILGEAATRAALQELATGVFFIQQQAMLTAITNKNTNATSLPQ